MKKLVLLFALFLMLGIASTSQAQVQDYSKAIGLRVGYPVAASFKMFITDPGAIELYAGFRGYSGYGWFAIGGQYQHHFPISAVEGLAWYIGGGAVAQFWNFKYLDNEKTFGFGINAVGGVDYKFANIPLAVSVDWMPTIFITGYGDGFGGGYGGLSARYVLN